MTPLELAQAHMARGIGPLIRLPYKEKGPKPEGWQNLRHEAADLPRIFNGVPCGMGVILGVQYGLSDMDLDCMEAVKIAGTYAPETGCIFGRQSKPKSHYFYYCDPTPRSVKFTDPTADRDKSTLLEIRALTVTGEVGMQTVLPGSTHPSGEVI